MNNTQSIIVYRNPMEQAMWESNAPFIMIITMVVVVLSVLLVDTCVKRFLPRRVYANHSGHIAILTAMISGGSSLYYLV